MRVQVQTLYINVYIMRPLKTGTTVINGFTACQKSKTIYIYECKYCYALTRISGENHNCPDNDNEEDEGILQDLQCDNFILELKNFKRRNYVIITK